MLSSTCNTGPSSTLKFVYKVYGKIPLFILIGRIGLSLAKCRWWDAHKVLMECQSSLIIIIIIFQISCISPLICSNHELKSSWVWCYTNHTCDSARSHTNQWRIQGGGGGRIGRGPPPFFWPIFYFFFGRFLLFSGAASRNLDSRPPLFTDPGSASANIRSIHRSVHTHTHTHTHSRKRLQSGIWVFAQGNGAYSIICFWKICFSLFW